MIVTKYPAWVQEQIDALLSGLRGYEGGSDVHVVYVERFQAELCGTMYKVLAYGELTKAPAIMILWRDEAGQVHHNTTRYGLRFEVDKAFDDVQIHYLARHPEQFGIEEEPAA